MRSCLFLLPLVVLMAAAPSEGSSERDAVPSQMLILDISGLEFAREVLYRNFNVMEDLGDLLVARPSPSDPAQCLKMKIPGQVVNVPVDSGDLFIVSLKGIDSQKIEAAATLLYDRGDIAVVAAKPTGAAALRRPVLHYGLEEGLRPLNLDRIAPSPSFRPPLGWKQGARAADPKIQAMVSQVSQTNLQNVVQDLENMIERKASSGAFTAETYLVNSFNAIGGLTVTTHHFNNNYADNVIAELPGVVDPSVIYIVGGHYDSTSYSGAAPGADDNASGTSAVREIARILSQYQFKYTLRFIAFNAEEIGLVGSDEYCDWLVNQGADVQAMINTDMNAYRQSGDPYDVEFVTNYSSTSLINFCKDMYATYVPSLGVNQGSLSGGTSDHQSFTEHGYTACFPFEDLQNYSPYIHTSNDKIGPSANDFLLSKMITQGILASIATLASPVDLAIDHTALGDTTDGSGPYAVEADVSSLIGSNITQVTLYYDLGGGFQTKSMVHTGFGDTYISSIPGLSQAGSVRYYFEAMDDQGNYERLPDGLGADYYEFFVGYMNDVFADDFEINDNGWTHGGTGQDDWMRDVCTGNGGYDPAQAASGTKVWGNDLGPSGWNGNYSSNVNNWLESPSIDCTGETGLFLRYQRWLTVEEGQYDQAKILVNGNQVFVNPYSGDLVDSAWTLHEIDISAYADNNPDVKIRFTLTTDGGKELGGWNIDDLHVGTLADPDLAALSLSEIYVQASMGGAIAMNLKGGGGLAGRTYIVAMSASGTDPGTPIGSLTLPLNWDFLTSYGLANLNTPVFDNFAGNFDGTGDATATFNVPVIPGPGIAGLTMHFAWLTLNPVDSVSNAAGLLFVP